MTGVAELARVEGPGLVLRLIEPEDAGYVYALRRDPAYNRHLSQVRGTAEDQRRWIESYKAREAALRELYYVIERKDATRCGLVRLYDIDADSFTWGSWILDANKPAKAALESAVLVYKVAFDILGLAKATFDVRRDNDRTLAFHRRFGAKEIGRDDVNLYFEYPRSQYIGDKPAHLEALERKPQP